MQLKKVYRNLNPELLYDEMRDLVLKQGLVLGERKLETYSLPGGSSHVSRATMTFATRGKEGKAEKECIRVHIVGEADGETKMMVDVDEQRFPPAGMGALEDDLDFVLGSYEVKQ